MQLLLNVSAFWFCRSSSHQKNNIVTVFILETLSTLKRPHVYSRERQTVLMHGLKVAYTSSLFEYQVKLKPIFFHCSFDCCPNPCLCWVWVLILEQMNCLWPSLPLTRSRAGKWNLWSQLNNVDPHSAEHAIFKPNAWWAFPHCLCLSVAAAGGRHPGLWAVAVAGQSELHRCPQ